VRRQAIDGYSQEGHDEDDPADHLEREYQHDPRDPWYPPSRWPSDRQNTMRYAELSDGPHSSVQKC
jgi:hypothetical protein